MTKTFVRNFSRKAIGVREGVRIPGGHYIFTDHEARIVEPATFTEIDHLRNISPEIIQQWPDAEMVVEVWVKGYGYKKIVKLEPAGGFMMVYDIGRCFSPVCYNWYELGPGNRVLPRQRYLTTVQIGHCW